MSEITTSVRSQVKRLWGDLPVTITGVGDRLSWARHGPPASDLTSIRVLCASATLGVRWGLEIFYLVGGIILVFTLVPLLLGNRGFWTLVAKYPDEALGWFEVEPIWRIQEERPNQACSGPFLHPIDDGPPTKIWGEASETERSPNRFRARQRKPPPSRPSPRQD